MKIISLTLILILAGALCSLTKADEYGTMASNDYQLFLAEISVTGSEASSTSFELTFSLMSPYPDYSATDNAANSLTSGQNLIMTVPGPPIIGTASGGNAEATVQFSPPGTNGGSTITGYTVISTPPGGIDSNAGTTLLSHTVTGLTNGTTYTFTVTATNAIGTGSPSEASNSISPATAPGTPIIGTATGGDTKATVQFFAPATNGGSSITGYTVTSSPSGGVDSNAGTTLLAHTITGLTNGTVYTFTVTASNAIGTSSPSAASNTVTPVSQNTQTPPPSPTPVPVMVGWWLFSGILAGVGLFHKRKR